VPYHIYRLTSPSGKCYVGISKNVRGRWRSHCRVSGEGKRHPLYDAMRKYGSDAFRVETLATYEDQDEALTAEVMAIFFFESTDRKRGYNLSPGGEYDCMVGPKMFWDFMRANPDAFEAYRGKLCEAQRKRALLGLIKCPGFLAFNAALTPRERWRRAYRASRIARQTTRKEPLPLGANSGNPEAVKAAWVRLPESKKKRHAIACRERAKTQWANRTDAERASVSDKISKSVKALHDDPAYRERLLLASAKGRAVMDRAVQGAAASKGLKGFWTELKKDPEKYAAHIEARKVTLKATLEAKGFKCK
jgi:predicted GIY-YIG superfamily endonuclease